MGGGGGGRLVRGAERRVCRKARNDFAFGFHLVSDRCIADIYIGFFNTLRGLFSIDIRFFITHLGLFITHRGLFIADIRFFLCIAKEAY